MRAWNNFVPGNWSSPINISVLPPSAATSTGLAIATGLSSGELLGIIVGALIVAIAVIACIASGIIFVKRIRKRKKLWRAQYK